MANNLTPEQIDAIARAELAAEGSSSTKPLGMSNDEIDRIARAELVKESGPAPSGAASFWEGLKSGAKRSLQAIQQAYIHGGIVAPEDPNPLTETQKTAGEESLQRTLASDRAALGPYAKAHPYLTGAGEFVGGLPVATAVSAPSLAAGGLPAFALGGAFTSYSSPVESESGSPISDTEFAKTKAKQALYGGLAGLATGGMLRYPGLPEIPVTAAQIPGKVLNYAQSRAMARPQAQEGLRIAAENNMDLSPAMVSGSRLGRVAESAAGQSASSADIALAAYNKLGDQAITRADAIKQQWSGKTNISPEQLGQQIRDVTRENINKIQKVAGERFERGMNDLVADAPPTFDYTNTKNALTEYMDRYRYSNIPDEITAYNKAKNLYDSLDTLPGNVAAGGDNIPMRQAIAYRRSFGNAASGSSTLFHDVPLSENQLLGIKLKKAIDMDFEAAANNAGGNFGENFRRINQEYREAKNKIGYIKDTVLGKVLGRDVIDPATGNIATDNLAVDKIAERVLNLSPNDARLAKSLLDEWNPQVSQDIKAYALQRAMEKGADVPATSGNSIQYSPAATIKSLQQTKSLDALLSPEEKKTLQSFQSALSRWADRYGVNTSFTTPASEFMNWFKSLSAAGVAGAVISPAAAAGAAALSGTWYIGTRQIAKMMLNPGDRMKLMKVINAPRASENITRIASELASRYAVSVPGPIDTKENSQ